MRHILFEIRRSIEDRMIYMGIIIPIKDPSVNIFSEALINLKSIESKYRSYDISQFMDNIITSKDFICMHQSSDLLPKPAYTIFRPLITYARNRCALKIIMYIENECFKLQFFDKLSMIDFHDIYGNDVNTPILDIKNYPRIKAFVGKTYGFYNWIKNFEEYLYRIQSNKYEFFRIPDSNRSVWILHHDADDEDE